MPTTERAVADPVSHPGADAGVTGVAGWMGRALGCGWRVVGFVFGFVFV